MTTGDELAVWALIERMREIEPDFARGRALRSEQVGRIVRALAIDVFRMEMTSVALLSPWIEGTYYLAVGEHVHRGDTTNFLQLHECTHVIREDVREPTRVVFVGDYPIGEKYCNTVAALGVFDGAELEQGIEYAESRIRARIHIVDRGWDVYRVPELARRVCDAWAFIRARDGYVDTGADATDTMIRTRRRWRLR